MKRLIEQQLLEWSTKQRRKPLIVRGARQVGKTFIIKKFASDQFKENFVLIDFEKSRTIHKIFSADLEASHLIKQIELLVGKKIVAGKTLLFFDEIQACPNALTALRYFYEELPELHVIAAGSLLEFALDENSFPVGRVEFLEMFPLTFNEFLMATQKELLAEILVGPPQKVSDAIHEKLLAELRTFLLIGGMPEVVSVYISTNSFVESLSIHKQLVESYLQDFSKYKPHVDADCLATVLRSVARNVGSRIKYTRLAEGYSGNTLKKAFELLVRARIVTPIYGANPSGLPLGALKNRANFKAIIVDIGLMHALCGINTAEEWSKERILSLYNGAVAEQFVGQELKTFQTGGLYYWSREEKSSTAEVDYLIAINGHIRPIEVKSGSAGRLKSIHLLLQTYKQCERAFVLNEGTFGSIEAEKLDFIPLYFAGSLFRLFGAV